MDFMKWYKAYANLKGHPKRFRFEEALGIDTGLHYIHLWFSYVSEYAQDGDVTHFGKKEIAKACEWKGDAELFFQALSVGGFIDKIKGGDGGFRLIAHDWFQENERYIKENERRKPTGNPRVTHVKPTLEEKRIEVIEEKRREEKKPFTADAVEKVSDPAKADAKNMRDYFHSEYKRQMGRKPSSYVPAKWLPAKELSLITDHGLVEMKRRIDNYLESTYVSSPSYLGFLNDPDKWLNRMLKPNKGTPTDYTNKRKEFKAPLSLSVSELAERMKF